MKYIASIISELGIEITDDMVQKFILYKDLLIEWNKKMNLTAITDEKEIAIKHFVDSVSIATAFDPNGKHIIDIGTGAGFPGIPIKICFTDTKVLLVDSLNKRINFLQTVIENLNLNNIEAFHSRAEDLKMREQFDVCTSRAVSQLNVILEYSMPFVRVGGIVVAMKSENADEEIVTAKKAIEVLGGELADVKTLKLPQSDIKHKIIIVKKIKPTNEIYPRTAKKIIKAPII